MCRGPSGCWRSRFTPRGTFAEPVGGGKSSDARTNLSAHGFGVLLDGLCKRVCDRLDLRSRAAAGPALPHSGASRHQKLRQSGCAAVFGAQASSVKARPEGLRIKHFVNGNSLKLYDQQVSVLCVETTINHPEEFKVWRAKENDPEQKMSWRELRRGLADLPRRAQVSPAANESYLSALAVVEAKTTPEPGSPNDLSTGAQNGPELSRTQSLVR